MLCLQPPNVSCCDHYVRYEAGKAGGIVRKALCHDGKGFYSSKIAKQHGRRLRT
jgi:hypothetical protein